MWAWFSDVTVPWGASVRTIPESLVDLTAPKKSQGRKKVKFWLGDPDPKFLGRGSTSLGALVSDLRAALNTERMVALSVAVTEQIAIEKFSLTPSSGETGGGRGP